MEQQPTPGTIWTIGHSTHPLDEFIKILQHFEIAVLADVRHFPGSKRFPHFNKEAMRTALPAAGIDYVHLVDLGGRRKPLKDSVNTAWRHQAFRGYADHMQTVPFKTALRELEDIARNRRTAYMCSEAVWWSCHRSLISDQLKAYGWKVCHIMQPGKLVEHPFTSAARLVNGELRYDSPDLFSG